MNRSRLLLIFLVLAMQTGCVIASTDSESINVIDATGKSGNNAIFAVQREVVSLSENPLKHAMQRHVKERTAFLFELERRDSTLPPTITLLGRYDSTRWLDREVTSGTPSYGILKSPRATLVDMSEIYRRLSEVNCARVDKLFVSDGSLIHYCDNEVSQYEGPSFRLAFKTTVDEIAATKIAEDKDNAKVYTDSKSRYDVEQVEVDEGSIYVISRGAKKSNEDVLNQSIKIRIINKASTNIKTHDVNINHGESFVGFKPGGWVILGVNGDGYPNKFKVEKIKIINIHNDRVFYLPPFPSGSHVFLSDTKELLFFTINRPMGVLEVVSFQFENEQKIKYEFDISDLLFDSKNAPLGAKNVKIVPLN